MQVSIDTAKADLAKLIEAAQNGEEVVIARDAVPMVKLVPIPPRVKFKLGIWADRNLGEGPDFFEPMSEDDLQLWEGGP
ncbi:type II toxin-antitoxin system Phd/YefM family antitoxin [Beijerinckia sp. L45]|uniref:type II toxin-antitoxin system Phd/YefM family antitoxin n=1 Tax=Beijerinckia sp. L45 TaxID=1641855 RepID=UPI00131DE3DB|nr:type II toxin-antitoxin system prevent-host-death family antitoxin [Beijerinckia sp. L45]